MALGVFQQHNVHTKFCKYRSSGSKANKRDMQVNTHTHTHRGNARLSHKPFSFPSKERVG